MKRLAMTCSVLSAFVLLIAGGLTGCTKQPVPEATVTMGGTPARLVIVTPHNEAIRQAFEDGFADWHARQYDQVVAIRWVPRGTPQCLIYIEDAATNDEIIQRRLVPDLMFGGGVTEHTALVDRGFTRPLPDPKIQEAIPSTLAGIPLVDEQGNWHASALSDFGIVYNQSACSERRLPPPQTWEDLAKPEYFGWVAIADPTRSGSNRFCLDLILQKYGWEQGWAIILRSAANCRTLLPSSSAVLDNVASGMCLAGLSVNFTALQTAAAHPPGRMAFVSPTEASAITPDVISVLKHGSNQETAERFLSFCLSDRGQALWGFKGSFSRDGTADSIDPIGPSLFRYPVVPGIYDRYADKLAVPDNPFKRVGSFSANMDLERRQARIIGPLLLAACSDNHILLQRAWKAVINAGLPAEALAELTAPPFAEEEAYALGDRYSHSDEAYGLTVDWTATFKARFEKVLEMTAAAGNRSQAE